MGPRGNDEMTHFQGTVQRGHATNEIQPLDDETFGRAHPDINHQSSSRLQYPDHVNVTNNSTDRDIRMMHHSYAFS